MFRLFAIFFIIAFLFHCVALVASEDRLIGKKAPMISGRSATSVGLIKLNSLLTEVSYQKDKFDRFVKKNGKYVLLVTKNVVVLNFFSTSCVPCIREIPTFNRIADKYAKEPVKFMYVNVDPNLNVSQIRRFIARKQIKVPMMLPNQKEALQKYNAYVLPRLVVIDRNGVITNVITGFHENLSEELSAKINRLIE